MTNRNKRLKKGIDSLNKQISIHEKKIKTAEEENNEDLAGYYKKEIQSKREAMERKMKMLEKK
jgi:hypothetical protein